MWKISVIIPIYNVEAYLPQCINSVVNQTYQNMEIILVNDGSTDSCPQICDEYASNDPRVKVIHKENGGLSDARNEGLKSATGDFISFVDSDDLLSPHFFQKLFQALTVHNADIAECEFKKFVNEAEIEHFPCKAESVIKLFEGQKILQALLKGPLHVMVWNKLYKSELVCGRNFPINRISEDVFWTYQIYGEAARSVKIDDELYFYRQRENSIMGATYSIKRLDSLVAYEEKIEYLQNKFPRLVEDVRRTYCFLLIDNYIQLQQHREADADKQHRKIILKKIKKHNRWSELKNWHWKNTVWYQLFLWAPYIYLSLRKYMDKRSERLDKKE